MTCCAFWFLNYVGFFCLFVCVLPWASQLIGISIFLLFIYFIIIHLLFISFTYLFYYLIIYVFIHFICLMLLLLIFFGCDIIYWFDTRFGFMSWQTRYLQKYVFYFIEFMDEYINKCIYHFQSWHLRPLRKLPHSRQTLRLQLSFFALSYGHLLILSGCDGPEGSPS